LCAATIITWSSVRPQAPTPSRLQDVQPQKSSVVAQDLSPRANLNPDATIGKAAAHAEIWHQPERTIQFFNNPDHAPAWVIKRGQEFWRSPVTDMETSHSLVQNPVTGVAEIDAGIYYARADRDGLKFSPSRVATPNEEVGQDLPGSMQA